MNSEEKSTVGKLLSGLRFGRFVSVGVVGATAETIVLFVLTALVGVWAIFAKVVGAEVSITIMFLLNDRWTFAGEGDRVRRSILARYLRSHVVRVGGITIAFIVLWLLVDFTEIRVFVLDVDVWPTVANVFGIAAGMVLNYLFESLFTWRIHQ